MSKLILYAAGETAFTTNGLGILSDCTAAGVTEERNGLFELEFQYPVGGIHYDEILLRGIVTAKPNPTQDPQPFRVYRISKPINGMVTVYARHISYDLAGIPVKPFTAGNAAGALSSLAANAAVACPFTFWTDLTTAASFAVKLPTSLRSVLGGSEQSILDVYGGEFEFDRFAVKLHGARGENRGVSIRYGKNLTDLVQEENCADIYTGVYPYWTDGGADGDLVQLTEGVVTTNATADFVRVLPLDLSDEFEDSPTQAQLRQAALDYAQRNAIGTPKVSLTVSFVQLEQTEEYRGAALLERVSLCDTVNVEFAKLGVSATAKCVKTVYLPLLDRYDSVELGDARTTLADTIAQQGEAIKKPVFSTALQNAVENLTNDILGAKGGAARFLDTDGDGQPDTLYIADNVDPAKAVKVWRFNYAGWGASTNGYNGPFTLGATLAGGIVADFVTTGTMNASLIKTGIIQNTAKTFALDLDASSMRIGKDSDASIKFKKNSIEFVKGGSVVAAIDSGFKQYNRDETLLYARTAMVAIAFKDNNGAYHSGYILDYYGDATDQEEDSCGGTYINYFSGSAYSIGDIQARDFLARGSFILKNSADGVADIHLVSGGYSDEPIVYLKDEKRKRTVTLDTKKVTCSEIYLTGKFTPASGKSSLNLDWVSVKGADGKNYWALCGV